MEQNAELLAFKSPRMNNGTDARAIHRGEYKTATNPV